MKKLLALLLAAVMVLSLAACGGTNTDPTQAPTDGATEPTEAPTETPTDAPTTPVARENKLIFGTNTDVTGDWTNGIVTNGASDMMISSMINDYGTLVTNQEGNYVENKTVLKSWERKDNEDGSATYTISINEGLVYNNGEPITIKDYAAVGIPCRWRYAVYRRYLHHRGGRRGLPRWHDRCAAWREDG